MSHPPRTPHPAGPSVHGATNALAGPHRIPGRLEVALRPRVVRRALKYMVIVGAILITINHGDAILRGDITTPRLLRMLLTCMVPYCVSTLSSVEAVRATARDAAQAANAAGTANAAPAA